MSSPGRKREEKVVHQWKVDYCSSRLSGKTHWHRFTYNLDGDLIDFEELPLD